jgi:predicted esterase
MTREACEEFMFGQGGVMQLIADKQYTLALEAITSQSHLYPEISKVLSAFHISLAAHLGDIPQALDVMKKSFAAGIYLPKVVFNEEADPPGYATLFGNPGFEHLKKLHQEGYREEIKKAAPVLNRVQPITRDNTPPLLIAFHGNTSNVELEVEQYRSVSRLGWLLVQPQSAQSWTAWGYVWGDMDVTEQQVRSYWNIIQEQNSFDHTRVVTAGISKGGEVAIWSAMTGIIPACGFIAVAPGGPFIKNPDNLRSLIKSRKGSGLRGYLMVGDQDRWGYEATKGLASILKAEGLECELEIYHGLEHQFPNDFEQRLTRALKFVTET